MPEGPEAVERLRELTEGYGGVRRGLGQSMERAIEIAGCLGGT